LIRRYPAPAVVATASGSPALIRRYPAPGWAVVVYRWGARPSSSDLPWTWGSTGIG
jgi:hypothetical protein